MYDGPMETVEYIWVNIWWMLTELLDFVTKLQKHTPIAYIWSTSQDISLKDTLKKCLDKRNKLIKSGAASSKLPKLPFFEHVVFLHEKKGNKPAQSLYCRSLIPILKELPTKKKRLARIKISQLLFDLQYDEDGAQMI